MRRPRLGILKSLSEPLAFPEWTQKETTEIQFTSSHFSFHVLSPVLFVCLFACCVCVLTFLSMCVVAVADQKRQAAKVVGAKE